MQDTEWIVGRKEIMAALHKDSWSSVRRMVKRAGIRFVRWPDNRPAILRSVLNEFLVRFGQESTPKRHPLSTYGA